MKRQDNTLLLGGERFSAVARTDGGISAYVQAEPEHFPTAPIRLNVVSSDLVAAGFRLSQDEAVMICELLTDALNSLRRMETEA